MFVILMPVGVIYIIAGLLLRYKPPQRINPVYGYRTKFSMASQKNWDIGQKIAGRRMVSTGVAFILLSTLGWVIALKETHEVLLALGLLLMVTFSMTRLVAHELTKESERIDNNRSSDSTYL